MASAVVRIVSIAIRNAKFPADMGGGGQAKLDVHIWLKFDKYLISNLS